MKTKIVTICFIILNCICIGQTGGLFFAKGSCWSQTVEYTTITGPGGIETTYGGPTSYFIKGDTVIGGRLMQKKFYVNGGDIDTVCYNFDEYVYYDSNRVYTSSLSKPDSLILAYDFNLNKADSFLFKMLWIVGGIVKDTTLYIKVDSVNTVFWHNKSHKWIRFKHFGNLNGRVAWEENVGDIVFGWYGNDYRMPMYYMYFGGFTGEVGLNCFADSMGNVKSAACTISSAPCKTTGIAEINEDKIKIFPNPGNTILQIIYTDNSILNNINLYDVLGSEIVIEELQKTNNGIKIDVNNLPNGVYLFKAKTKEGISTQKIIIQH
jgi:hypothetical protein